MARDLSGDGLLETLADDIKRALVAEGGVELEKATEKAIDITENIRSNWGGHSLYIPRGVLAKFAKRDADIVREFTGTNHAELAEKHSLTYMRIRQILARAMRERRNRR